MLFANAILLKLCSSHVVVLYQWPLSLQSPQKTNPISNRSKWQAAQWNSQNIIMCDADKVGQNLLKCLSPGIRLYEKFHKTYGLS